MRRSGGLVVAAAILAAHFVAERATRDALFLGSFDAARLPLLLAAGALLALVVSPPVLGRLFAVGPAGVLPPLLAASAVLSLAAWRLAGPAPRAAATLVFLHGDVLGTLVIAAFTALVGETWGPQLVRRPLERVAGAALVGVLSGGVLADRMGARGDVLGMLPILAGLHAASALALRLASPRTAPSAAAQPLPAAPSLGTGWRLVRPLPHLRTLALVVLLCAAGTVPLDYVLRARAADEVLSGEQLLQFFARFHAGSTALAVLLLGVGARAWLARFGLESAAATWGAGVAAGATVLIAAPSAWGAALGRGLPAALQGSLHRAGRELLFTPVPNRDRAAASSFVEVGAERAGTLLGAAAVAALLAVVPGPRAALLAPLAAVPAVVALLRARRLHAGYLRALEESLTRRAVQIDADTVQDRTTRLAVAALQAVDLRRAWTTSSVAMRLDDATLSELRAAAAARTTPAPGPSADLAAPSPDPVAGLRGDLLSGDAPRLRRALRDPALGRECVPLVVPLLGRDEVAAEAIAALRRIAVQATGQLVDVLLDPEEPVAVRRRLPRVLAFSPSPRGVEGLLRGLQDSAFEVRRQCARALVRLHLEHPEMEIDRGHVLDRVRAEARDSKARGDEPLPVERPEERLDSPVADELLQGRTSARLEHVFTLLALLLPLEPLRIAFAALHTEDAGLRGTARDWLASALPSDLREDLGGLLAGATAAAPQTAGEALDSLVRSRDAVRARLAGNRLRLDRDAGKSG